MWRPLRLTTRLLASVSRRLPRTILKPVRTRPVERGRLALVGLGTAALAIGYRQGASAVPSSQTLAAPRPYSDGPWARDLVTLKGDGSDESVAIKAAHDAAFALGARTLHFGPGTYNAPSAANLGNIIFIGEGTLTGAYRKQIIPAGAPNPPTFERGIRPASHLPTFIAAANPVVLILGDSITTPSDQIDASSYISRRILAKLKREYPNKTITFLERGIPTTGWSHLASASSIATLGLSPAQTVNFCPWMTDSSKTWMSYVQAAAPDLIIFHFGANTGTPSAEVVAMVAAMTQIEAFAKVPDRILITPMVPTLQNATYNPAAQQEARDQQAAIQRGYALRRNFGLIDNNRHFNMARDGRDILAQNFKQVATNFAANTSWTYTAWSHDYYLRFQLSAAQLGYLTATPISLILGIGSWADNNIEVSRTAGGNFAVLVRTTASTIAVPMFDTGIPIPASVTGYFELSIKGTFVTLAYSATTVSQGNFQTILYQGHVERFGGVFAPRVAYSNSITTSIFVNSLALSEWPLVMPTLTDAEMYGIGAGSYGSTYGGNLINHPSSIGCERIYGPMLARESFAT